MNYDIRSDAEALKGALFLHMALKNGILLKTEN